MTTPKLHPAAVRAAGILVGGADLGTLDRCDYEEIINDAIDDHLKSEGWVELRVAAAQVPRPALGQTVEGLMAWDSMQEALRRVRGEKP